MSDPHEARREIEAWFGRRLDELDADSFETGSGVEKLQGMVADAIERWRLDTGEGLYGLPTELLPAQEESVRDLYVS
jgi:hypothetical protein